MLNFVDVLSKEKFSNIKRTQFPEKILLSGRVGAETEERFLVNISPLGDFLCLYITGNYSTLIKYGDNIVDNGVCYLRGLLIDGTGARKLFNDFIPFDLFLSPGRVKSQDADNNGMIIMGYDAAEPSSQLFYPLEFQHMFDRGSSIIIDVKNDSNIENTFNICFHGIRLL